MSEQMMRLINLCLKRTWFPLALQIVLFCCFGLLIIGGLAADPEGSDSRRFLRNTNLANLIVWSYWWPLLTISAVFLGRVWCMVCPMELMTSLASRIGWRKKPPAYFRSGWVMTAFYIVVLFVGIHTLAIHRIPFRMAIYLLLLMTTAMVSGLLFSRNTFCAHICPVGHLLGLYARLAPLGWGVKSKAVCAACKDKSCISHLTAYRFQGRSCGVGLYAAGLDQNTDCLLCGQCLKACDRNNPGIEGRPNPGWFKRRWFNDLLGLVPFTPAQAAFALVVSGFVVYEVFTEWPKTSSLILSLPVAICQVLNLEGIWANGMVTSVALFVILPLLFWFLPLALFRLAGGRLALKDFWLRFGVALVPIMAAAHIIKALLKMTSRLPYWSFVLLDPVGEETAQRLATNSVTPSTLPAWLDPALTFCFLMLMGTALILSLKLLNSLIAEHIASSGRRNLLLYIFPILYGGGFFIMIAVWRLF